MQLNSINYNLGSTYSIHTLTQVYKEPHLFRYIFTTCDNQVIYKNEHTGNNSNHEYSEVEKSNMALSGKKKCDHSCP